MPECGSQCFLCDLPIRFDTYKGCSHDCKYCFASKHRNLNEIEKGESAKTLMNFIKGQRKSILNWCDWEIPLHWGGMSDPFQPVEEKYKISYECLKVFAETQYPFIVSTKGRLIVREDYLDLISKCNCVVQISVVCDKYDKIEKGAPSFQERLNMISVLSKKVKRVIVRIQPYMHEVFNDVFENLEKFKNAGAYGVIIEGMKFQKKKPSLIKVGADYTYPYEVIKNDFLKLKEQGHKVGLKVYSGENRTRKFGDSLTCCGIEGMEGFKPNTFNLNHILNGDKPQPTDKMQEVGTADIFVNLYQTMPEKIRLKNVSFASEMLNYYQRKKKSIDQIMGVDRR